MVADKELKYLKGYNLAIECICVNLASCTNSAQFKNCFSVFYSCYCEAPINVIEQLIVIDAKLHFDEIFTCCRL